MRRGNLTRPSLRGNEVTWQSHFFCFFLYKNLKMRSSRWKAPLRMTPVASDEILTPLDTEGERGRGGEGRKRRREECPG
jgi:hypothetical protein